MNKKILSIVLLIVVSVFASSCAKVPDDGISEDSGGINNSLHNTTNEDKQIETDPPTQKFPKYRLDTIEELSDLIYSFTEKDIEEIESIEEDDRKGGFKNFINKVKEKNEIMMPLYEGKPVEYVKKYESSCNIIFDVSGDLSKIDIMWYMTFDKTEYGNLLSIPIIYTYIDDDLVEEANEKGFVWYAVTQISPDFTNPQNFEEKGFYSNVYERTLETEKGPKNIVVYEFKDDDLTAVRYIQDNLAVLLMNVPKSHMEEIVANISFEPVQLKH